MKVQKNRKKIVRNSKVFSKFCVFSVSENGIFAPLSKAKLKKPIPQPTFGSKVFVQRLGFGRVVFLGNVDENLSKFPHCGIELDQPNGVSSGVHAG